MARRRNSPETENAIRAFRGRENAAVRRMIRNSLDAGLDPRPLRHTVALTAIGLAKLEAVYEAWTQERA